MLHVLTAQILADERERAIQRRLQEHALRLEAMEAKAARRAMMSGDQDAASGAADRPCAPCPPPARATAR